MSAAVENLRAWRESASPDDVAAGRDWYPLARRVACDMSRHYDVSLDVASGVIAALSPRCAWAENLAAADTVLRAYANGEPMPTALPGVYGENVRKAWRIAQYGAGFPRCDATRDGARGGRVRCHGRRDGCPAAEYLHGPKVSEFAATIAGDRDGRVVDIWATRAADVHPCDVLTLAADDPLRDGNPRGRFAQLQDAYATVAAEYAEDPRVTQAIIWTRIRRVWHRSDGRRLGQRRDVIPF